MSTPSSLRLQGRVAIVTGAAQGIGARYAAALAAEGAALVCADVIDAEPVAAQIRAAGGRALALRADVSLAESVRQMAAASVEAFGRIDVLINNAGLFANLAMKPFEQIAAGGVTMLLVEQNTHRALDFVDRAYVLENGRTVLEGSRDALLGDSAFAAKFLGLA